MNKFKETVLFAGTGETIYRSSDIIKFRIAKRKNLIGSGAVPNGRMGDTMLHILLKDGQEVVFNAETQDISMVVDEIDQKKTP